MRARHLALLALTAALLTTGCLGDASQEDPGAEAEQPAATDSLATLYLTEEMGLTQQAPSQEAPGRVATGDFYATWTAGEEQPTWTGHRLDQSWLVRDATLTFHYTAENAAATTGPQDQGFPEFVVYLGHTDGQLEVPMGWASVQGPDLVEEGETVEISAELTLPTGGLVLPEGHQPLVKIAPVQAQQEEGSRLVILLNGTQAPTRVDLTSQPVTLPAHQASQVLDKSGQLVGSAYALGQTEGVSSQSFELQVPEEALGMRAQLVRTQGAGIADIDLEVRGPDGEVVAMSVTPEDDEAIALHTPNLAEIGPGTWRVVVTNYGNVATTFDLQASLLEPAS